MANILRVESGPHPEFLQFVQDQVRGNNRMPYLPMIPDGEQLAIQQRILATARNGFEASWKRSAEQTEHQLASLAVSYAAMGHQGGRLPFHNTILSLLDPGHASMLDHVVAAAKAEFFPRPDPNQPKVKLELTKEQHDQWTNIRILEIVAQERS